MASDPDLAEEQNNGWWTDLHAVSSDGSQWYPLTDFTGQTVFGALAPTISSDGNKVAWGEPYQGPESQPSSQPYGYRPFGF
jgi:hypothetical protein